MTNPTKAGTTEIANRKYDDYKTFTVTVTRRGPNQGSRVFTKVSAPSRLCAIDVVVEFARYCPADITRRFRFEVELDGEFDGQAAADAGIQARVASMGLNAAAAWD